MSTCMGHLLDGLKPAFMMVVVQIAIAGVNIFYKLAANNEMNLRVLVAYRFIFATAFMVPLALVFERKSRPKLRAKIIFQAFLCGLFGGSLCQNLYAESLVLTSATFASAMTNLVPAITFVLAISFRLEKLAIETRAGKAKVLGTLIGIGGAMVLTFYKGVKINIWSTNIDQMHHEDEGSHVASSLHVDFGQRIWGSFLALASCFSYSLSLIVQGKMSKEYPCKYSGSSLMCIMGAIQSIVYALQKDRDWHKWKLGWNIRLLSAVYLGIIGGGLTMTLAFWCVQLRGPLFASVFNPLTVVVVAFVGSLILDEKLHLGSILGSISIVCGLYAFVWGKVKEMDKITKLAPFKTSGDSEPIEIVTTTSIDGDITATEEEEENYTKEAKVNADHKLAKADEQKEEEGS